MTVREAQLYGRSLLTEAPVPSPSPALDVDCFLQSILGCDKTFLLFKRDTIITDEQLDTLNSYIHKRQTGLPVAYILGHKEFYGRDFYVTPSVLIPKPDTELLVEKAIEVIKSKALIHPSSILTICDMCTGSGCVGISIMAEVLDNNILPIEQLPSITLADINDKALDIARTNADNLLTPPQKSKLKFVRTNLFDNIGGSFDLIVSNPPYVPYSTSVELLKDGRSEPLLALNGDVDNKGNITGDEDGLGIIRNLIPQSYSHLAPEGVLIVESGEYNALTTQDLFIASGFKDTVIFKDLEGQLRDTYGIKS